MTETYLKIVSFFPKSIYYYYYLFIVYFIEAVVVLALDLHFNSFEFKPSNKKFSQFFKVK